MSVVQSRSPGFGQLKTDRMEPQIHTDEHRLNIISGKVSGCAHQIGSCHNATF